MIPTERKLIDMAYELTAVYAREDGHDTTDGLPVGYLKPALASIFATEARFIPEVEDVTK